MKIRDPKNDKIKSNSQQYRIFEQKLKCIHEDCESLLTIFKGPGERSLCRMHQRNLHDYGGYGRLDSKNTLSSG